MSLELPPEAEAAAGRNGMFSSSSSRSSSSKAKVVKRGTAATAVKGCAGSDALVLMPSVVGERSSS